MSWFSEPRTNLDILADRDWLKNLSQDINIHTTTSLIPFHAVCLSMISSCFHLKRSFNGSSRKPRINILLKGPPDSDKTQILLKARRLFRPLFPREEFLGNITTADVSGSVHSMAGKPRTGEESQVNFDPGWLARYPEGILQVPEGGLFFGEGNFDSAYHLTEMLDGSGLVMGGRAVRLTPQQKRECVEQWQGRGIDLSFQDPDFTSMASWSYHSNTILQVAMTSEDDRLNKKWHDTGLWRRFAEFKIDHTEEEINHGIENISNTVFYNRETTQQYEEDMVLPEIQAILGLVPQIKEVEIPTSIRVALREGYKHSRHIVSAVSKNVPKYSPLFHLFNLTVAETVAEVATTMHRADSDGLVLRTNEHVLETILPLKEALLRPPVVRLPNIQERIHV